MYTKTYKTFLSLLLLSLYTTVSRAELAESTILSTTLENQQHEQHNSADYVATLTPEIAACFMLLGSCFTDAMGSQALHIYNGLQQNNLQFSYSIIIPALIQILDLAHKKSKSEEIAPVVQDYFTKLLSGEALEKALEATVPVATLRSPIACVVDLLVRQSLQVGAYLTVGGAAVINELAVLNALRLPCNSISGEALIDNSVADCKLQTIVTPGKVANSATTATSSNIPNTIVLRDGSGNFSAGTITANLNGSATNFSGPLMGDVTGTQNATVVSFVGGQPAADVAAATVEVEQATSSNIPNTLVERDATGSFAAQDITVDGNINITNPSTVTEGNILKTGQLFIHNFGTDNTFVGLEAGNTTLTGSQNTAVGRLALQDSTSGSLNTALGSNALTNNTTGSGNTAVGGGALLTNSTGSDNVAIGSTTLFTNSTGSDNTAVGRSALLLNSTGSENTAVGRSALLTNMMGSENTAVGLSALLNNSTGNFNTALGRSALLSSTGNLNTAVGYQAGLSLPSGDSNIYVGANAGSGVSESNTIRIGVEETQTATFIAGIDGAMTAGVNTPVLIDTNGQLGTVAVSLRRYKENIQPMAYDTQALLDLEPVTFTYKGQSSRKEYGLIAEDVAEKLPDLVVFKDGQPEGVRYHLIAIMLLNEVKKLKDEIKMLTALVNHYQ